MIQIIKPMNIHLEINIFIGMDIKQKMDIFIKNIMI